MQLMCDALSVLGSRHGLLIDPIAKKCGIIRYDRFEALPELQLKAGVSIKGREFLLPLCAEGGAFYRGVDLRGLADRYWEWQVVTNTQAPKLFFETFSGNNLCFYPRGVAIWGFFDALAGRVINAVRGLDSESPAFPMVRVPRLYDADWKSGACSMTGA